MFDHVGIVVADLTASRSLYTAILTVLGYNLLQDNAQNENEGWLVYGVDKNSSFFVVAAGRPSFWNPEHSPSLSPIHCAFTAPSKLTVDQFHTLGITSGAKDNGAPGERNPGYYATFLIDLGGNNIEAGFRQ